MFQKKKHFHIKILIIRLFRMFHLLFNSTQTIKQTYEQNKNSKRLKHNNLKLINTKKFQRKINCGLPT